MKPVRGKIVKPLSQVQVSELIRRQHKILKFLRDQKYHEIIHKTFYEADFFTIRKIESTLL